MKKLDAESDPVLKMFQFFGAKLITDGAACTHALCSDESNANSDENDVVSVTKKDIWQACTDPNFRLAR